MYKAKSIAMVQPQIDGLELLGQVGEGSCGAIFIARDAAGGQATLPATKWYAVRVFNALAVNRPLIENMVKRLAGGTYPKGVVPIVWKDSKQGQRCMVMPMLAEVDEENDTVAPRSLQEQLADYPGKDAWPVIEKLAHALAEMHHCRIPHGNLKPGNVFFNEQGELLLTDFAMGHMPGIGMLPYTDAQLYAPPEQLSEPEGYLTGKGYAWDTHAFAVLAFRLLTGKFPRSKDDPRPAEQLECRDLAGWPEEAADDRERRRRQVICKCLSINPEDRYGDLNEVLHAWETIDAEAIAADEKARLIKNAQRNRLRMTGSLILAAAVAAVCILLASMLAMEKSGRSEDIARLKDTITTLEQERDTARASESAAIKEKNDTAAREQGILKDNAAREAKLREQLSALGITNDHLLAWMMRNESSELPELKKSDPARLVMTRELNRFLKLTEGENQFLPIRARVLMQLAELEIHDSNPAAAAPLLEQAASAWNAAGIEEPGYPARIARARLACLMQALDKNDPELTNSLLTKARKDIQSITAGDTNETRRINAVMQIIEGNLLQSKNPAKALEHFQLALKELEGVHNALPEHIALRSDLARHALHSASLAESLNLIDDAAKLRSKAAVHLRWLLAKNPSLKLAKVKLAEIEIMAAESDMRAGSDSKGAAKLTTAEKLLSGLPADDNLPDGASMQIAITKGLRAVLLRDRGRTTEAARHLDEAIGIVQRIVTAQPNAREPLYRLAVFHWQRGSLYADGGNSEGSLSQGQKAAGLMQQLLANGAGKRDTELRRSLAYLYGDLGHSAMKRGKKAEAIVAFKQASIMWQSLISRNGGKEEYTEGLRWSKQRYQEAHGN